VNLDHQTIAACLVALQAREAECAKQGLSTQHWSTAAKKLRVAVIHERIKEIQPKEKHL
jgi:predicted nucleotidyltransferase